MTNRLYTEFLTAVNIAQDRCLSAFHMENYLISPVLCTTKQYVCFHMIFFFLNWVYFVHQWKIIHRWGWLFMYASKIMAKMFSKVVTHHESVKFRHWMKEIFVCLHCSEWPLKKPIAPIVKLTIPQVVGMVYLQPLSRSKFPRDTLKKMYQWMMAKTNRWKVSTASFETLNASNSFQLM